MGPNGRTRNLIPRTADRASSAQRWLVIVATLLLSISMLLVVGRSIWLFSPQAVSGLVALMALPRWPRTLTGAFAWRQAWPWCGSLFSHPFQSWLSHS